MMVELSTDKRDPPNEEILNVLRRHPGRGLGTTQIANTVGLSTDGARNRLKEMEESGWIETEPIGSGQNPTVAWYLSSNQRTTPISPEINRLVRQLEKLKSISSGVYETGKLIAGVGLFLIVVALTAALEDQTLRLAGQTALFWGYVVTISGGLSVLVGIGAIVLANGTEYVAERSPAGE